MLVCERHFVTACEQWRCNWSRWDI